MSEAAQQGRQGWIDVARGTGIILVVFGHVLRGVVTSSILPVDSAVQWVDYGVYSFHMPLFFFLAGLNVPHVLVRGRPAFIAGKARALVPPYVLWTLIQGCAVILMAGSVNAPVQASAFLDIWYRPMFQYWFLYALLLCHGLVALIGSRIVLVAVAIGGILVYRSFDWTSDLAWTLHFFAYYLAGMLLADRAAAWTPRGWAGLAAIWLAFAACLLLIGPRTAFYTYGIAILPASILGVAGTIWLCKILPEQVGRWLVAAGAMSMTIYVMHILAGSGIRVLMMKLHMPTSLPWLYVAVGTVFGVLAPMLAHRILARARLLPWLGLAPWPRAGSPAGHTALAVPRDMRSR